MGAAKKKWSKGKAREATPAMALFDKKTYERCLAEVPKMKLITPSALCEKLKCNASLARKTLKEMHARGDIKLVVRSGDQLIYTRNLGEE